MSGKVKKKCRVCGKLYTPCVSCENDKSIFHWRAVACSPECAREYVRRVEEARSLESVPSEDQKIPSEEDPSSAFSDVIEGATSEPPVEDANTDKNDHSVAPRKRNRKKRAKENIEQIENEWVY